MTESPTSDDIVAFFHALRPELRRALEALAERDRTFGEDVTSDGLPAEEAETSP